jgi:hypothetical protein
MKKAPAAARKILCIDPSVTRYDQITGGRPCRDAPLKCLLVSARLVTPSAISRVVCAPE